MLTLMQDWREAHGFQAGVLFNWCRAGRQQQGYELYEEYP
jgi:hypothetical protein